MKKRIYNRVGIEIQEPLRPQLEYCLVFDGIDPKGNRSWVKLRRATIPSRLK
jgi:hypothetical protein